MNPYLETIFCDDIRQEVNGKRTLVGVYGHNLLVESFPITLPKLYVAMRLIVPVDTYFDHISFEIIKGDEGIVKVEVPPEVVARTKAAGVADVIEDLKGEKVYLFAAQLVLSQIEFKEAVPLKVRVKLDGLELKGVGLQIATLSALKPSEETTQ